MARAPRRPKRLDEPQLYDYAVKALAARARSTGELRRLLGRRAADPADVGTVMQRLTDRGYLNDGRFAQAFASWRLENQRFGRGRVLRDLRSRQVPSKIAEQAVSEVYAGVDESQLLREQLKRRLRQASGPLEPNRVASLYRTLRRAGFGHAAILAELRRAKTDAELLERLEEEQDLPPEIE